MPVSKACVLLLTAEFKNRTQAAFGDASSQKMQTRTSHICHGPQSSTTKNAAAICRIKVSISILREVAPGRRVVVIILSAGTDSWCRWLADVCYIFRQLKKMERNGKNAITEFFHINQ